MNDNFMNVKAKHISFSGSFGSSEKQLNRILDYQRDAPDYFHIKQIIPLIDRGTNYFWVFYSGTFPEMKVWEGKN